MTDQQDSYNVALAREKCIYEGCAEVHNLPAIFHYWSERYLRPKLLPYGLDSPNAIFRKYLEQQCGNRENLQKRFVSLGAGNCDLEIDIARHLLARGMTGFTIECFDLNAAMLERGRMGAATDGTGSHLRFVQGDLNAWVPEGEYDAAFANQTLHHVVNLEGLFAQVKRSLRPDGVFIISDMIGRNGHQRWPEALDIVREFWRTLPPSYRFNRRFGYYDELYEDWDCSVEGFEGVRSQDILPLLLEQFHFHLFIPFGNLIDPFIDRSFGQNFDAGAQWDRAFIDRVHHRDDLEISRGNLKPTHMLAVIGKDAAISPAFPRHLSPQFCLRPPGLPNGSPTRSSGGFYHSQPQPQPQSWPHSSERELEIACQRLGDAGRQTRKWITLALRLQKELGERTAWALQLEKEHQERTAWALKLDNDLSERTAWALRLEKEQQERTAWALRLEKELDERTAWALQLRQELQSQTSRTAQLEEELSRYMRNRFRFALRLLIDGCNRLKRVFANPASSI